MQDTYSRVNNINDLMKIQLNYKSLFDQSKFTIRVCSGAGCISSKCHAVKETLLSVLKENNLDQEVAVFETGCIGTCDLGPVMVVSPGETFYTKLNPGDIPVIVQSHLIEGNIALEKTYFDRKLEKHVPGLKDINFFKDQVKIALRNCGLIDHSSLAASIANDGYQALAKVLMTMNSEDVVKEIKKSGLRGRGGSGFPTGLKWEAGLRSGGNIKYIACNADEGDPGAFMDRSILEGDPHSVIEGIMIGGYAIGAAKGYVYVRAEYPLAVERLGRAIDQARTAGLLGKNILGSSFSFDIEIRIGAGAFVCGEETALMASVEGKRGEPKQKPPFPFQSGLFGKPTIINNVETYVSVPAIILNGSEWFANYGTSGSKGTKVIALAGDIVNTGLVEIPMGMPLGDILYKIGGGIPRKKLFKAAQTGGPSGGCITKEFLNTPVDYDSLVELGAIMGSGGLISMDEDTCMVDMARFFMEFIQDESCGKCVPCRTGTKRMLEILERITQGDGREGDIELLEELGESIRETAICGLGQTAPNPVLNMIKNFREEYEEHIKYKYCRAGVCEEMFLSPCENACPANVNVPGYIALVSAGRLHDAYTLIRKENPFPAVCGRVCTHPCENKCRRAQLDEPIAIADLKRYVSDYIYKYGEPHVDIVLPSKGKSIGIIGAGPSGLTCAYYLALLGHTVEVYEAESVAGGVLAFGIPEYRLPKDVLQREIKIIEQTGVKIHLNFEVGKDISFVDLRQKHDAVYIATGNRLSNRIGIPGEKLPGIYYGLDFLRDVNLHRISAAGENVAIIGGGNTAIDAARVALRLGAKEVTVLYRRSIEDMPADPREITDALEEGVKIITMVAPVKFNGKEKIEDIECVRMEFGQYDNSGRRKPQIIAGSEFNVKSDMVIPAVSQYSDLIFINKDEFEVTKSGYFVIDKESMMTTVEGVFAGGDIIGSEVVVSAIADGKKAAKAIDKYLGGQGLLYTGEEISIPEPKDEEELTEHERFPMKYLDPEQRKHSFAEVTVGLHNLNATAESMRCLRCDRRA